MATQFADTTIDTDENPLWLAGCTREQLRRKLAAAGSPVGDYWRHLLTLARRHGDWYAAYTVLPALITDDPADRERARQTFLRYLAQGDEALFSREAQLHTHTVSAQLGRWAIYYDWLADLDLFTDDEHARIQQQLIDHAFYFSAQQLAGRCRKFDNQVLANAFGTAAVGYVCGHRRGEDALARRLLSQGLLWTHELMRLLPASGYTGEGSTYLEHVVQPVALFAGVLLEAITGRDVMRDGATPDAAPARQVLVMCERMLGPAGLTPGWDDYGFQHASIKSGLTYLAAIDDDDQPLQKLIEQNLWYRMSLPAWEIDDRLWTLVWWPQHLMSTSSSDGARFEPWMIADVAGALQSRAHRSRLFQCWDACGGIASSGRANVDPNTITFEAYGSPILIDGHGELDETLRPLPTDTVRDYAGARRIETIGEYAQSSWGATLTDSAAIERAVNGCVGHANALVLDDEAWYVPLQARHGVGRRVTHAGPMQVIESDATAYYIDRYDVQLVMRTSALIDGRYAIVSDRFQAETPHDVTWQAFARGDVHASADRVTVTTPEQVRCDIVPLQAGALTLDEAPDYPNRTIASGSTRVRQSHEAATDVRLDTALLAQPGTTTALDLTDAWTRRIGDQCDDDASLASAYLNDPNVAHDEPRVFERTFELTPQRGASYWLVLGAAGAGLELRVNDQVIEPTAPRPRHGAEWKEQSGHLPWHFDITAALRSGENHVRLAAPWAHGEALLGPAEIRRAVDPQRATVERQSDTSFTVRFDDQTDHVLLDQTSGDAIEWADGTTDARHAVRLHDGRISAAAVTHLSLADALHVTSHSPCDFAWDGRRFTLARVVDGCIVEAHWPNGLLRVEVGGCIHVTFDGQPGFELALTVPWPRPVYVNGAFIGSYGDSSAPVIRVELTPSSAAHDAAPHSAADVCALEARAGRDAIEPLVEALRHGRWPVRMAAAEALGRLGATSAVPVLLEQLDVEEQEPAPTPIGKQYWRWNKMLRNDDLVPAEAGDVNGLDAKRWRVKRAIVTALGRIGDGRAVTPLQRMLERADDFFPVTSQLAVALGRLGDTSSTPVLARHLNHVEVNTAQHAQLAHDLLNGQIGRNEFESRIGVG